MSSHSQLHPLPSVRHFIPELIAIALSFLDQPEFLTSIHVSKDWNRASQLPSASPTIDIQRFIPANRGIQLKTTSSRYHCHLIRWSQIKLNMNKSGDCCTLGSGSSHRFIRALDIALDINIAFDDTKLSTSIVKLVEMIRTGELWSNVEVVSITYSIGPRYELLVIQPILKALAHKLRVFIYNGKIENFIEMPNLGILQCDFVGGSIVATMKRLESIHLTIANHSLYSALRRLCLDGALREITISSSQPDLPRRLFDGKELPLVHLDVRHPRTDSVVWLDCLARLPSVTSIGCFDSTISAVILQMIEDRPDSSLIQSRLLQLTEMNACIYESYRLPYHRLTGLRRLDLGYIGFNSSNFQISPIFAILTNLEHLSFHSFHSNMFPVVAIRSLSNYCKSLRAFKLLGDMRSVWCDESVALLSSLPDFQRWTVGGSFAGHPTMSEHIFDFSTAMLRSISNAKSFRSIEFYQDKGGITTWHTHEKVDSELIPDLDYTKLQHFRVYLQISPHRVQNHLYERIYSISEPLITMKKNVPMFRRWEDQFGNERTRPIPSSKWCSLQ